jgi:hypothetical protein
MWCHFPPHQIDEDDIAQLLFNEAHIIPDGLSRDLSILCKHYSMVV